jgi:4-amino-4-deoxy-L-arabinose transferase-like glycosyltransferase
MQTKSYDALALFFIGLILFIFGLQSQEIIGFEARFYLFALEMWRHGSSWFPTTYQQPYPDYPATTTYFIYLAAHLFGGLNKFTAVLPTAIASAATVTVTYLIGATQNRRWGWSAACFLLFTMVFITEARTISLDQFVTLVTTLCFYFLCRKKRFLFFIPLFIFAFAIRGPVGIIIPTGVLCVSYLLDRNIKQFFTTGIVAVFLLVICSAALMMLAYHAGGYSFVQDVLRMEVGSRMHDVNRLPFSFYFTESLGGYAIAYPLAIFILLGCLPFLFVSNPSSEIKFLRKCVAWALVILIGLSIPADKKMRYILPMAPALALICGYLFSGIKQNRYLNILRIIFKWFCYLFPMIALLVIAWLIHKHVSFGINYPVLIGLFLILQLLIILFRKYEIVVLALAALTFLIANIGIVETINLNANQTRSFVLSVEKWREQMHSPLIFFQEGPDGLPIKYLVNMSKEEVPVYLYQPNDLLKLPSHVIVIVGVENVSHISANVMQHFRILMQGKIGHDGVVVFIVESKK